MSVAGKQWLLLCGLAVCACAEAPCGPERALIVRALDGDTIELEGGRIVRYLLVDAPELSRDECYARQSADANRELVVGRTAELTYDEECRDAYGRLLAFVLVDGHDMSRTLIERGLARVLYVPPAGVARRAELFAAQSLARAARNGLWGACARGGAP